MRPLPSGAPASASTSAPHRSRFKTDLSNQHEHHQGADPMSTVNANREYFEMVVRVWRRRRRNTQGGWRGYSHIRVKRLENYAELLDKLTTAKGAIKVFCEVAPLSC